MSSSDVEGVLDPADDAFRRQPFVRRCSAVLEVQRQQQESAVIGLVGAWGSGKSTTLSWVLGALDRGRWTVVEMGAWAVAGPDGITLELLRTLKVALGARRWTRAAIAIRRLARAAVPVVAPASSLLSSVTALGWVGDLLARLGFDRLVPAPASSPVPEQIAALGRLIAKRERATLVVIDDVDRLQPDELLALFKAVRVLGRLPRVHYLLVYDQVTLLQLMSETPVGRGAPDRALVYLEKVITLRLDQPPPSRDDATRLLRRELDAALAECAAVLTDDQRSRLDTEVTALFSELLTTARRVHRFTQQLRTYLPLLTVEAVDVVDFSVLALLRTRYPELYDCISRDRRVLTVRELTSADVDLRWWHEGVLTEASAVPAEERAAVQGALLRLFPLSLRRAGGSPADRFAWMLHRVPRRACNADYVGRYFELAPPAVDSDEPLITSALAEWEVGEPGPAARRLAALVAGAEESTAALSGAARLIRLAETMTAVAPAGAVRAAIALFPVARGSAVGSDPRAEAKSWLADGLARSTPQVDEVLHAAQAGTVVEEVARLTALCEVINDWELPEPWRTEVRDGVVAAAWELCETVARRGGAGDEIPTGALLRALDEASPAALDAFVPEALRRGVDVLDLATLWIDRGSGRRRAPEGQVALDVVRLLGSERASEALIAANDELPEMDSTSTSASRRMLVRALIDRGLTADLERCRLPRGIEAARDQLLGAPTELLRQRQLDDPDVEVVVSGFVASDEDEGPPGVRQATWDAVVAEVSTDDPVSQWFAGAATRWNAVTTGGGWTLVEELPDQPKVLVASLTSIVNGSGRRQREPVHAVAKLVRVPRGSMAETPGLRLTVHVGLWMRELDEDRRPADRVASEAPLPAALTPEEVGSLVDAATCWVLRALRSARPLLTAAESERDVRLESRLGGQVTARHALKVAPQDVTWRAGSAGATASAVFDVQQFRLETIIRRSGEASTLLLDRWLSSSGGVPQPTFGWLPAAPAG